MACIRGILRIYSSWTQLPQGQVTFIDKTGGFLFMTYAYKTKGTCSTLIELELDGNIAVSYTHLTLPTTSRV